MIDEEEFKQFVDSPANSRSRLITPALRENYEAINQLVKKGYQLTIIYDFLMAKGKINCSYVGFCRAWRVFKKEMEKNVDRQRGIQEIPAGTSVDNVKACKHESSYDSGFN